jgi:hypothetical protein
MEGGQPMKNSVKFIPERITKNTVRFQEQLLSDMDVPVIGTLYVQKTALAKMGYKEGNTLIINMEVER